MLQSPNSGLLSDTSEYIKDWYKGSVSLWKYLVRSLAKITPPIWSSVYQMTVRFWSFKGATNELLAYTFMFNWVKNLRLTPSMNCFVRSFYKTNEWKFIFELKKHFLNLLLPICWIIIIFIMLGYNLLQGCTCCKVANYSAALKSRH